MQEEQRSLSSVETLSVWKLMLDDTVRWQVLSVVVINIGMQLSGIDAVRTVIVIHTCRCCSRNQPFCIFTAAEVKVWRSKRVVHTEIKHFMNGSASLQLNMKIKYKINLQMTL